MLTAPKPKTVLVYNGKDISEDLSGFMTSASYTDNVKNNSDEIEISLEDSDARWRNEWYASKGDKINLKIGFGGGVLECGDFVVDEIGLSGPPDVVTLRGMAASIKKDIRTKKSAAHENKTLLEIGQATAKTAGLTFRGGQGLEAIRIDRATQNRETDLCFLRRLMELYGFSFSVRGGEMQAYSLQELEEAEPVLKIDRKDLSSYSFTDKATTVFKKAKVSYHDPKTKAVISGEHEAEPKTTADGEQYSDETSEDVLEVRKKVENKTQATAAAKAALHEQNSRIQSGSISLPGNVLLVSGVNFELTGMGQLSGKYHIEKATHRVDKGSGYSCELDIKRVALTVKKSEHKTPPPKAEETPRPQIDYLKREQPLIFRNP